MHASCQSLQKVARCKHRCMFSRGITGQLKKDVHQYQASLSNLLLRCSLSSIGRRVATRPDDVMDSTSDDLLKAKEDSYGGVIVDPASLPADSSRFAQVLELSLQTWRQQNKRGIWMKIPTEKVDLIPIAVRQGAFRFHHAEEAYVMLTHWIPDTPCTLPPNASHQVGIGAFVLNERQEVLAVQERNGPLKGMKVWKMPTGLVQAGEDLSEAAEREVLEETGIKAKFHGVLAMRQAHGFAFDKSDLFVVCVLLPEDGQTDQLQAQESEIEAAAWIPWDQYSSQPFLKARPLHQQILQTCLGYVQGAVKPMSVQSFEAGTGARMRRDLLLWCADASESNADSEGPTNGKLSSPVSSM